MGGVPFVRDVPFVLVGLSFDGGGWPISGRGNAPASRTVCQEVSVVGWIIADAFVGGAEVGGQPDCPKVC